MVRIFFNQEKKQWEFCPNNSAVPNSIEFDGFLLKNLLTAKQIIKDDWDMVFCIDGYEGCISADTIIHTTHIHYNQTNISKINIKTLYEITQKQPTLLNKIKIKILDEKENKLKFLKINKVTYSGTKGVFELILKNNMKIQATPDHKILTEQGWVQLQDLTIKHEVICENGKPTPTHSPVKKIIYKGIKETYDIHCYEPNHNFSANGIIVHNCGKSVIAQQCAKFLDPALNIDKIVFTPEEFVDKINKAKRFEAIVYDEAMGGLASRSAMTEINKMLVGVLAEIRQKNLFVFIVLPCFFELDRYPAIWRSRCLIHTYTAKGFERGHFAFYGPAKKKQLYILGKKYYTYKDVRPDFVGKFSNGYQVDEKEYREKKRQALLAHQLDRSASSNEAKDVFRNQFIIQNYKELKDKYPSISIMDASNEICRSMDSKLNYKMTISNVSSILKKFVESKADARYKKLRESFNL